MNIKVKLLLVLFLIGVFSLIPVTSASAEISLDPTFGSSGKVFTSFGDGSSVNQIITLSNGKKVAVGSAISGGNMDAVIVQHDQDGSLDTNFGSNGKVVEDFGGDDSFESIIVQSDGKYIVSGYSHPTGNYQWFLVRFNINGTVDDSFGVNGVVITFPGIHSLAKSLILQQNGKALAIGWRGNGSNDDVAVARYNFDGTLDTSFGTNGIVTMPIGGNNDRGTAGMLQPDGKIVILGDFDAGGHDEVFLVRLNANGSLDNSFGNNGKVITQMGGYDGARAVALQPDGKIVVTGGTNNSSLDTYVARYNSDGTLDNSFGSGGKVVVSFFSGDDSSNSLILQSDGKILLGGHQNGDFALRRLNPNGTLDADFGDNGSFVSSIGSGYDEIRSIAQQSDGKIVAAGNVSNGSYNDWGIARYTDQVNSVLPVPLFKQGIAPYDNNDPVWEDNEFDHANAGQFYCGKTMAQCGCATTSVAMILKYYGINKLPGGEMLDPGTFNTWLKNTPGGYNRNLGINWAVAATVARKAKSVNPAFQYDALEVDHNWDYSPTRLITDLEQGIPNVLQEDTPFGMHFVVATGIDNSNNFTINDPFYNRISLASYSNTASSVRRFVPAYSDMSYISFAVDEGVSITVKDQNGNAVGRTYLDFGPGNPTGTTNSSAVNKPLTIFEYSKPQSDTYQVTLHATNSKSFQLDTTIITQEGDIKTQTIKGIINPDGDETFSLAFNKQSTNESNLQKKVTFDSTIQDIKELRQLDLLHFSLAISTTVLIKDAERLHDKRKDKQAKELITGAINLIEESPRRFVDPVAEEILLYDFNALKML